MARASDIVGWLGAVTGLAGVAAAATFSFLSWRSAESNASVAAVDTDQMEISYERSSNSIKVSTDIVNSGDVRINGCKVKLLYRTHEGKKGQAIVPFRSIGIEPGEEATYTYVDSGNGDPANDFIVETWTACNTRKIHSVHYLWFVGSDAEGAVVLWVSYEDCDAPFIDTSRMPTDHQSQLLRAGDCPQRG
jgi:hypothetical protein